MIKKVLGYILSIVGILGFLSLYFLIVFFKDNDNIGYIIMAIGYIVISVFIIGIRLIKKNKKQVH